MKLEVLKKVVGDLPNNQAENCEAWVCLDGGKDGNAIAKDIALKQGS